MQDIMLPESFYVNAVNMAIKIYNISREIELSYGISYFAPCKTLKWTDTHGR